MFVDKKIYEKVVSELTSAVNTIGYANDDDSKNDIPPLITAEHLDRVSGFIEKAKSSKNTEITTGGYAREGQGNFYTPTVVAGASYSDEIVQKEVFGPVVSVTPFSDVEDAIGWANDSRMAWHHQFGQRIFQKGCQLRQDFSMDAHGLILISCLHLRCRMVVSKLLAMEMIYLSTHLKTIQVLGMSWLT